MSIYIEYLFAHVNTPLRDCQQSSHPLITQSPTCERQVIEADGAPHIVAQLKNSSSAYRLAAAQCVHSLSRSVKVRKSGVIFFFFCRFIERMRCFNASGFIACACCDAQKFCFCLPLFVCANARCCAASGSLQNLRTALLDAGVVAPVLELVSDPELDLRIAASAALCNLVLEFTPMKQASECAIKHPFSLSFNISRSRTVLGFM